MSNETIFALASGAGRSGVAVIRVSGPQAFHSLGSLTQLQNIQPRYAYYAHFRDSVSRETIDRGLVLFFEAPASYTGEDVAEYHLHGSVATIHQMLEILSIQPNHRMAEPGEFTRRAFENGKMDLTEAEAVADLIDAQTHLQKRQALKQMDGVLRDLYEGWTGRLKRLLAHIEAGIEFPDEDDPEEDVYSQLPDLKAIQAEIRTHLLDGRRGELLREGVHVAIIGAPNAGKSSLLNALAQRDVAIVSDMPGTTRDSIEVTLNIGGYPVVLKDTAGLRDGGVPDDAHGQIEAEGIKRALRIAEDADLKILLHDGLSDDLDPFTLSLMDENAISVLSKSDLTQKPSLHTHAHVLSSKTGDGIAELLEILQGRIESIVGAHTDEAPALTRVRHRTILQDALCSLQRCEGAALPELLAEDVRLAMRSLGKITGQVHVEDLLDVVFQDFCIGK